MRYRQDLESTIKSWKSQKTLSQTQSGLTTSLEKAKSLLMHKTYLASGNPETGLDRLQKRFSIIYREYEKIEETRKIRGESGKTAEDMILQYHFIAFENWKDKDYTDSVRMINQQINEQIKARRFKDTAVFIDRYSRELKESFGIMKRLLRSRDSCLLDIFALNRPAAFYPLLIKTYKFDKPNRRPNFEKIKRLIEIICFRFGIIGSRSDKGVSQLYVLARDFVQNSDQRQFNLESKFNKLIDDLKEFINKYCDDALFTDRLRARGFYEDVDRSDQRYLFWKYENYLREKSGYPEMMSHDEFITTNPRSKLSMEHIIPQNPEKSKVVVDNSILSITNFESQEFKENFLHSIGNLTIDPLAANSSKSNQNFENKDQKYFRRAPLMTQNELSDFLNKETRQWDKTSITNRADKIVKFALEHWDHQRV